ncbi:MAG: Unknown protein [uncultured Sulfurovum sp.]|uniref:Uncharacterized protein n=1 Tax=uncultured Sulfurovum sp. TaxID=269237 RepID=A0A6S6TE94_9BACT|nr:MAG: Unknown protein [uncultured Sulfurovum sp.]
MTELMMKMTSWLVAAMALGFIVAWLLSRIISKKRQSEEADTFSSIILERNNMIDKLEKNFRNERVVFEQLSNDLKDSEESLAEKTSLLTTLQHKLDNNNSNVNSNLALKEKNNLLLAEIQKLKQRDIKRVEELEGFEEILLLAEKKVEANERNYRQILNKLDEEIELLTMDNKKYQNTMKTYQKSITELQEELVLYEADSSDAEFIISKDQFVKIEEQLLIYQEEINILKNENSELLLKLQKNVHRVQAKERTLEEKAVDELEKERDDGSMVKVFRETYKKITKA